MRFQANYERALKAADKRCARVLEAMGYGKTEAPEQTAPAAAAPATDKIAETPKRRGRRPKSGRSA
jgi:hypothetical protein